MSKKQVMGHNPLVYRPLADAKFDFIPYTDSGSGKGKNVSEIKKITKKVSSYYLEVELTDEIKKRATEKGESYSHFVEDILKKAIRK